MSELLHKLTGVHKNLEVYNNRIVISQTALIEKLANGFKGEKSIFIKDIKSIQLKKPGALTNGYIQFGIGGGIESTGGIFDATKDENTIFFVNQKYDLVCKIKDTVERLISELHNPQIIAQTSRADELKKFKQLADECIITQEEYEAKKKQILGL